MYLAITYFTCKFAIIPEYRQIVTFNFNRSNNTLFSYTYKTLKYSYFKCCTKASVSLFFRFETLALAFSSTSKVSSKIILRFWLNIGGCIEVLKYHSKLISNLVIQLILGFRLISARTIGYEQEAFKTAKSKVECPIATRCSNKDWNQNSPEKSHKQP